MVWGSAWAVHCNFRVCGYVECSQEMVMDATKQLDIRIQEAAQKLSGSQMEVKFCILQDPCQPRQTLTARGAVHMECNKLLCG